MEMTDTRHPGLHRAAHAFLERHALHPDPAAFLKHGYVPLFLAAWRGSTGEPLELAACWGLWTWRADDVFDTELRDADSRIIRALVGRLADVLDGDPPEDVDQPITRALADLVQRTRPSMPSGWWDRYASELDAWLRAAADKLEGWTRPARTPSLRQYLTLRPVDGGMLLAAMWCELALGCVTPDWDGLLVHRLLDAFSAVGTLTNDLAASTDDRFTAQAALARTTGSTELAARRHVREQLDAEQIRFQFLLTAIRDDARLDDPGGVSPVTIGFAAALDRFLLALTAWTHISSRYALAAPAAVAR
ncbi:hypothetical protein ABH930_000348 [Kitasatospora sp. GAS204A]|uniref:terpene synthase family protein n=1 Tax=unclassified Kitasatospora TaxID=2633591 RepID=UPI00247543F4|nr:terpene synthase family protein [Kitasatospora sp. GAS204B]MDH6116929.1 hypothetical protein [Kitasatospora sp. GAS204B]